MVIYIKLVEHIGKLCKFIFFFLAEDGIRDGTVTGVQTCALPIRFLFDGDSAAFDKVVETLGETPLPKYIKRKVEPADKERFQTIFAKNKGAVSAPTAGMHFTKQLVKRLQLKGIDMSYITLHIGLGT